MRLPTIDPRTLDESALQHGQRVLKFILLEAVTATLTEEELTRADYAAHHAIISRTILPLAASRISDVRHLIHLILESRKLEAAQTDRSVEGGDSGPHFAQGSRKGPSTSVPLNPLPKNNPPSAGMLVAPVPVIEWSF